MSLLLFTSVTLYFVMFPCMFPYLWLSSFLSSLFLLYHFQQSRGKKSVFEEGDHQRAISSFASRAIEAHKQSNINGTLNNNLPKSSSNVTFISDENPLTTQNPLYVEGTGIPHEREDVLPPHSPRRLPLKDVLMGCPLGYLHRAWTLPSHASRKHVSDALSRAVIMDPVQWEQERNRADRDTAEVQHNSPIFRKIIGTKLSVKEKARQFEQQALQEMKQVKSRETRSLRSPAHSSSTQEAESILAMSSESLLASPDCHSSSFSSLTPCSDVEPESPEIPSIIITDLDTSEQLSPPPCHKPPIPSLRTKISTSENLLSPQPKREVMERIPDPPNTPPPPPPPPPPLPQTPPSFPPQLPSPPAPFLSSSSSTFGPHLLSTAKHTKSPPKQEACSQACVPDPPPLPRRELKGILKNIQNLADIEKSVANMYSQIDKNHVLPKHIAKRKPVETPDTSNTETVSETSQQNSNLSCVVEELEKRFPSQSTALWLWLYTSIDRERER